MDHRADVNGKGRRARDVEGSTTRVRAQIFPLLADLSRLQTLCDKVFNEVIPPSVAIFRPALPIVFCGVLHYPDMNGELAWRTGSLSQNELYFLVLLERYRLVDGREEFVELCGTTPFIFVDNAESAATGRERLGMPKERAEFFTGEDAPAGTIERSRLLRVETWEPDVDGHHLATLLEIIHTKSSPLQMGTRDEDRVLPALGAVGPLDWLKVLEAAKTLGERAVGTASARGTAERLRAYWQALQSSQTLTLYNVRQFADPERWGFVRYEDLVGFQLRVSDLQSLGFLGDGPALSQFRLEMRRSDVRPISQLLGLRVGHRATRQTSTGAAEFESVSAIAPIFGQLDVDFVSAERLCWRNAPRSRGAWEDAGGLITRPIRRRYNTVRGPSSAVFLERQTQIPTVDAKYLMLPADRSVLQRRIDRVIPREAPIRVTALGSGELAGVRLLAAKSRPRRLDEQEEIVWNDGQYISLSAPVKVEAERRTFFANFMFQSFTSNSFMVQLYRELLGEPTSHADFDLGESGWFGSTRDLATVLGVSSLAIDRSGSKAALVSMPLLDVFATYTPGIIPPEASTSAYQRLRDEVWPEVAKIMPMVSVGYVPSPDGPRGPGVLERIMVTSYDDASRLDVRARPGVEHLVRIHANETLPLCEDLGLLALPRDSALASGLRMGARGIMSLLPVVGYGEAISSIALTGFEVLWEGTPHHRRQGVRG